MLLPANLRLALARSWDTLKLRLAGLPQPVAKAATSRWDQPLSGDNWIGLFLIVLSLLSIAVSLPKT